LFNQIEATPLDSLYNKHRDAEQVRKLTVKTTTLDNEKIKIDVEGYEYEVLKGALNIISRYAPNILIELEERHRRGTIEKINDLLLSLNYRGCYVNPYESKIEYLAVKDIIKNKRII